MLKKLKRSPTISPFPFKNLEHFVFVIHGTPQIVRFAVNPDEHLIQVSTPVRI